MNCGNYPINNFLQTVLLLVLLLSTPLMAESSRITQTLTSPMTVAPLIQAIGEEAYNDAMASGKYRYQGNTKCRLCHREFFLGRKKDLHDFAMDLLGEQKYKENPKCLICHTTGFNVETGFISLHKTPRLSNVQCEGCHGPGSIHINLAREQLKSGSKEPPHGFLAGTDRPERLKKMCKSCHSQQWNRSFEDFESAYRQYKNADPNKTRKR